MPNYSRNRKAYETELANLLTDPNRNQIGNRIAKASMPWDVMVSRRWLYKSGKKRGDVKDTKSEWIEVKTSKFQTIKLNKAERTRKQLSRYFTIQRRYGHNTWYAFRKIGQVKGSTGDVTKQWRFFKLSDVKDGVLVWEKGITLKQFEKRCLGC